MVGILDRDNNILYNILMLKINLLNMIKLIII